MLRLTFIALLLASCATQNGFQTLYDHYFPTHGGGVLSSNYRPFFDKTLFGPPLSAEYRPRSRKLYFAFHGDAAAFHAFLHDPDRGGEGEGSEGEFSESWSYECVVLLLKLGDDRFSALLAKEDVKTRTMVAYSIDPQIDWTKDHFPKTRALYSYRYVRPSATSNQAMQRTAPRSVFPLRVAMTFNLQPSALSDAVADLVSR